MEPPPGAASGSTTSATRFAVLPLSAGKHYMMVSKWLGPANFMITLNAYGDCIPESEGGKATPLARPTAPEPPPTQGHRT